MNWFKQAQQHPNISIGDFQSYDTDEIDTELDAFIDGKKMTYYGMSSKEAEIIRWMANVKKLPGGVVLKRLKPYSDPKMHKKINLDHTEEEKQQMLSELPSQQELWGNNELV